MSSPRDATSVATRTSISPDLKSASAFVRSDWVRSLWMGTAAIPARSSSRARRLAAIFVRVKTSSWRQPFVRMRWMSSAVFRSRSTG